MYRRICFSILLVTLPYLTWSGPDPMRPENIPELPVTVEVTIDVSQWRLNLIRQIDEDRLALLNGKLLKVGSYIDGALVTAIDNYQVTLQLADDRSIELKLPSAELRNTRN